MAAEGTHHAGMALGCTGKFAGGSPTGYDAGSGSGRERQPAWAVKMACGKHFAPPPVRENAYNMTAMNMQQKEAKACFVGGGEMTKGILSGSFMGIWDQLDVCVAETDPLARDNHSPADIRIFDDPIHLPPSPMVFLCTQPEDLANACRSLKAGEALANDPVIVSVVTGISCATIEQWLGHSRLVRLVPNSPLAINRGCTFGYATEKVPDEQRWHINEIFTLHGGSSHWVTEESLLNAATALSRSGPAYCFLMLEAMVESGVQMGLDPNEALIAATHTMEGAAQMVQRRNKTPATLRERELAKGGNTTQAALAVLQERGFADALKEAMHAARDHATEQENDIPS